MCSMISAQCDRLRDRAEELRGLTPDPIVPNLVPSTKEIMAIAMGSAASEMCCAANTIWELRNKLAGVVDQSEEIERLKAENAKLRAECDEWHRVAVSKQDIIDHMRDARAENTKLRELVCMYGEYTDQDRCEGCVLKPRCNEGDIEECWQITEIRELERELGIEVKQ